MSESKSILNCKKQNDELYALDFRPERILYDCPYMEEEQGLPLLDVAMKKIEQMKKKPRDRNNVRCFPYCREVEGRTYIDIYMKDSAVEQEYKRFIFAEGYRLTPSKEKEFMQYMAMEFNMDHKLLEALLHQVNEKFPHIHLQHYPEVAHVLKHLYYALHRSGPYEILYKANLDYIAERLDEVEEYNMIGTSPGDIMNVQLGMLHVMNTKCGMQELLSVKGRETARKIYSNFHNFLRHKKINTYQWRYLIGVMEMGEQPQKAILDYIGQLSVDKEFYRFWLYQECRDHVGDYRNLLPEFPNIDDLIEKKRVGNLIRGYIEYERIYDKKLRDVAERHQDKRYESDDYVIYVPDCLDDMLRESDNQRNCLYQYVNHVAFYDTVILFMREVANLQKSLVTIRVVDNCIVEAKATCNKEPDERQWEFIVKYAQAKGLNLWEQKGW